MPSDIEWDKCKRWVMETLPEVASLLEDEWGQRFAWSADQADFPPRIVVDVSIIDTDSRLYGDEPGTRYPSVEERDVALQGIEAVRKKWPMLRTQQIHTDLPPGPGRLRFLLKPNYQLWKYGSSVAPPVARKGLAHWLNGGDARPYDDDLTQEQFEEAANDTDAYW